MLVILIEMRLARLGRMFLKEAERYKVDGGWWRESWVDIWSKRMQAGRLICSRAGMLGMG